MRMVAHMDRLLISISDFIATEPFGRTKLYELIDAGEIETVTEGRRRLIDADSYRRYIERLRLASSARPSPNPKAASHSPGGWPPGHVSPPRRQSKQPAPAPADSPATPRRQRTGRARRAR